MIKRLIYTTKEGSKLDLQNAEDRLGIELLFLNLDQNERGELLNTLEGKHRELIAEEPPELFQGTKAALDGLTVRKEG